MELGRYQVVQNKTKWMCFFFCRCVMWLKKDRIHSRLFFLPSQGIVFKKKMTQKWPLNSKKNVRNFASQMGWVVSFSFLRKNVTFFGGVLWYFRIPSASLYERVFETKDGEAHCECCCEFHSRPFAALPQTTKPQISGVSCTGCKKGCAFCKHIGVVFFCSTSCYKWFHEEASYPGDMHIN